MKFLVSSLAVFSMLTVSAFADDNGSSNILSKHQMNENFLKGDEVVSVVEDFTYATNGENVELKGALVTVRSCGFPSEQYAASRDSAHLRVLGGLISACRYHGYESYSVDSPTTGGTIGVYSESGIDYKLSFITEKSLLGKQLHQVCFTSQGICK